MTKFMVASRQAYEVDQQKVRLEAMVREMERESSLRAEVKAKLEYEVKEPRSLVEELKADAIEKDTRLDHLQKRSDELCTLRGAREVAIREFKASSEFTNLLNKKLCY